MGHLPTHLKEGVPGSSFREGSEEGDCGPDQVSILGAGGRGGRMEQMVGWFSGGGFETWGKVWYPQGCLETMPVLHCSHGYPAQPTPLLNYRGPLSRAATRGYITPQHP